MANTTTLLQRSNRFETYMKIARAIYKFLGVDLTMEPHRFYKYLQVILTLNFIFVVLLQNMYNATANDVAEVLLPNIIFANYNFVSFGKLMAMYYHRLTMTRNLEELKDLYPERKIEEKYQLERHHRMFSRLQFFIWNFYRMIAPPFLFLPLIQSTVNLWINGEFSYLVPISMWAISTNPNMGWKTYLFCYFSGGWVCICSGMSIVACDLLLYGLISQLCLHFDLISQLILEIAPDDEREGLAKLSEIVKYHRKVMELARKINSIFGPSIIFSVMSSSFILCLVTYQMLDDVPMSTIFKSFTLLIYESKQVVITCYLGQKVMEHSSLVNESLYSHKWYEGSVKYRRQIAFMLMCTSQPFILQVGGIADITLLTLKVVYGNAYRLFTVFKTT
ncbi:odorant receptor 85b-like [Haematobia irritans]|uniref:odorant receptor 85b-like n=1 Tax=Haematobia irritans TaxID=7368 RepID=UPI003F4FE128